MMVYGVNPVPSKYNPVVQYLVEHKPYSGKLSHRPFSFVVPSIEQAKQVAQAILSQEIEFVQQSQVISQTPTENGGTYARVRTGDYPRKYYSRNVESGTVHIIPVDTKTNKSTY